MNHSNKKKLPFVTIVLSQNLCSYCIHTETSFVIFVDKGNLFLQKKIRRR